MVHKLYKARLHNIENGITIWAAGDYDNYIDCKCAAEKWCHKENQKEEKTVWICAIESAFYEFNW